MFLNSEKNIAKCYVYEEGDETRKFELTDQRLVLRFRKKTHEWPLEIIKGLSINQRKLLIPIIFSGVFTPLIIVGFFKSYFNPAIAIFLLIIGVLSFYAGWLGQMVITIVLITGHQDIPVRAISENLGEFIAFFNSYIKKGTPFRHAIYAFVDKEENDKSRITEIINNNKERFRFYSYSQIKKELSVPYRKNEWILAIDPLSSDIKINYQRAVDGTLTPGIISGINKDAILGVYPIHVFIELLE